MTALGDPTRQAIFERLVAGPRPVGELAGELPVSRPAVSQHLKVLKDAGLVIDRKGRAPPPLPGGPAGTGRPARLLRLLLGPVARGVSRCSRARGEDRWL